MKMSVLAGVIGLLLGLTIGAQFHRYEIVATVHGESREAVAYRLDRLTGNVVFLTQEIGHQAVGLDPH